MSSIRTILVHLDGSASAAARLRVAHQLSALHGATLNALFAVSPHLVALSVHIDGLRDVPLPVPLLQEADRGQRDDAERFFKATVATGTVPASWQELSGEPPIEGFVRKALYADLLVLGQHDPDDTAGRDVPTDFVEAVIVGSGKPALIVPLACNVEPVPKAVLVAWKPAPEAAHALAASLPFLQRASAVHVVNVAAQIDDARRCLAELAQYLRAHGITAVHAHPGAGLHEVDRHLLALAADINAELLVMGCYGHTRARELILGGASRNVLRSMGLPVLMAH